MFRTEIKIYVRYIFVRKLRLSARPADIIRHSADTKKASCVIKVVAFIKAKKITELLYRSIPLYICLLVLYIYAHTSRHNAREYTPVFLSHCPIRAIHLFVYICVYISIHQHCTETRRLPLISIYMQFCFHGMFLIIPWFIRTYLSSHSLTMMTSG